MQRAHSGTDTDRAVLHTCEKLGSLLEWVATRMFDVHRKNLLTIQLGRYSLKGKTDELIVPFKQSDDVRVLSQGRISLTSK